MTNNNKFFSDQKDNTAVKLKFYSKYIETYLIKVLMQFGVCFIGDLFCGKGRNGDQKGSPLLLMDIAAKILNNSTLKREHEKARVLVLFADSNKSCVDNLNLELKKRGSNKRIKVRVRKQNFQEFMVSDIADKLKNSKMPKFIFLDPFTYSTISIEELKGLMNFDRTEVLLFCPVIFAYRFADSEKPPQKLITFLEDFTTKGVANYADIHDFVNSIHSRLIKELKTKFIKPIILDAGRSKHALFYITRHPKGMMIMNNLFIKDSADGRCINVKKLKQSEIAPSLFKKSDIETDDFRKCILNYQSGLIELLKTQGKMTNMEIIYHAIINGWPPKYAKEALNSIKNDLDVKYLRDNKTTGYYISEANWDKELCEISFVK